MGSRSRALCVHVVHVIISTFLIPDTDGSFDILKFADPTLDLDDAGGILDLMDDVKEEEEDKATEENKTDEKQDIKKEDIKPDAAALAEAAANAANAGGEVDFQAKFLEFSKKRDGTAANGQDQKNKSQIAAILQAGGRVLERKDSQTSETGSIPAHHPSPLHQIGAMAGTQVAGQLSPSGGKYHQQSPSTPGMASPKVMPSPKSNAPSPRTPGVASPFSQHPTQQQSPFSQHSPFSPPVSSGTQSPFTAPPTSTSAPQSPFGLPGQTPSPFPMPPGASPSSQPQYVPMSQAPPASSQQSPRSPRGTVNPTNQYMQGSYSQQIMQVPPRGSTLTPTPNSILYGQPPVSQHMMRGQQPHGMMGPRPPFTSQAQAAQSMGMEIGPHTNMEMTSPGGTPRPQRPPMTGMPPGHPGKDKFV